MALNLVQHRVERSVWDQLGREWDTERWIAGLLGSALMTTGLTRRSPAGLLLTLAGGSLAWWAAANYVPGVSDFFRHFFHDWRDILDLAGHYAALVGAR